MILRHSLLALALLPGLALLAPDVRLAPAGDQQLATLEAVWTSMPNAELGDIGPLKPQTEKELVAAALAARQAHKVGVRLEEARAKKGQPIAALPKLSLEAHRLRVQSVAAWTTQEPADSAWFGAVVRDTSQPGRLRIETDRNGGLISVGLYGVDVLHERQPFGDAAKAAIDEALREVDNHVVIVPVSKRGATWFGLVLLGNDEDGYEPLGERLVRQGLAWWNERSAALDRRLAQLQFAAMDAKLGCFSSSGALAPGTFARTEKKALADDYEFGAEVITAEVFDVSDGDTFQIHLDAEDFKVAPHLAEYADPADPNAAITIRVSGIDTPEIDQPGGVQAWVVTHLLLDGKQVRIVLLDSGGYGRVAALAICPDGETLGEKLVRVGRARHYEYYFPNARLAELEQRARQARVGLWGTEFPMIPGTWRDMQIDVLGFWRFEGPKHYITVDVDGDSRTTEDRRTVTSGEYREQFAMERFERLAKAWRQPLETGSRP